MQLLCLTKDEGGRANAQNLSFSISLPWPIHIINPVDKTKLLRATKGAHNPNLNVAKTHAPQFGPD